MGLGDAINSAWQSAGQSAREAAANIATGAVRVGKAVGSTVVTVARAEMNAAAWAFNQTMEIGIRGAIKVTEGAVWTSEKAIAGAKWTAEKAVQGAKWTEAKAIQGAKWTEAKVIQGAKWTAQKTQAAYSKAKAGFQNVKDAACWPCLAYNTFVAAPQIIGSPVGAAVDFKWDFPGQPTSNFNHGRWCGAARRPGDAFPKDWTLDQWRKALPPLDKVDEVCIVHDYELTTKNGKGVTATSADAWGINDKAQKGFLAESLNPDNSFAARAYAQRAVAAMQVNKTAGAAPGALASLRGVAASTMKKASQGVAGILAQVPW